MTSPLWIWQQPDWPQFHWQAEALAPQLRACQKVSKATATRHLSDLVEKGCLRRLPGGGRSTRYAINTPVRGIALPTRASSGTDSVP
ncbi:DUF4172 domain-containing protein [Pseudoxanthomonas composti]|uniref:DUF4172 domain-containing protein n=1 Tax=Pseudoxanthomonas composti TaxID=2137479 RepID=A0A4Q1JXD4_9GAMM|nr:DUF4172 domain-containing protein [Pseudoxanthomonas composti]RXR06450.1 DUF4172 domain-containing protein [Pseudoxanthomonas composti]